LEPGEGVSFARVPQNAYSLLYTPILAEIADALGRDGKADEGLSIIDEALARSEPAKRSE
jgi:hypothetical protein